jgi:hypothetical protein
MTLDQILKLLCHENCGPNHVLDNGRVWGFCGLQRLIHNNGRGNGIPEEEIRTYLLERWKP